MASIVIHHEKVADAGALLVLCPFGALELSGGKLSVNAACKMCRLCVKKGPPGVFELVETVAAGVDKDAWRGVAVYVDHADGVVHNVTLELIGKARELAAQIKHPVYCLMAGSDVLAKAKTLLDYGVDEVFVYDDPGLRHFRAEPYAAVFADFINHVKPSIVLVGGTPVGRSLAPRVAARFRSGLTADCTSLEVKDNTDLIQIRPAFGGNIMAKIHTPRHRPQFATARYKIFSAPEKVGNPGGKLTRMPVAPGLLASGIEVLEVKPKAKEIGIEEAEVIVVAGRGLKKPEDLGLLRQLADRLGGQLAGTRSLIEAGWLDAKRQIGLSGRTVKPKLIIAAGVSGAIQFVAGMKSSEYIVAINSDPKAPIFKNAHVGLVGDLYEIVPELLRQLDDKK